MGTEQRMRRVLVLVLSTDREMEIKFCMGSISYYGGAHIQGEL